MRCLVFVVGHLVGVILRKAEVTISMPNWAHTAFETGPAPGRFTFHGGGRRARSPGPKAPSAFKTAPDPYRVHPPMRKAGYSKAKPCGSLRLPTGPWTSHVHFPWAGNQGLEPCRIGFGDQFAPCALPKKWTWRDLNTLPPACKTGALPGELQAHVSEWGILPSRPPVPETGALLSELHSVGWPVRIELTHRRATTSRLSTWLRPQWSWLALPQPPFAYRANALLNELQLQSPPFLTP